PVGRQHVPGPGCAQMPGRSAAGLELVNTALEHNLVVRQRLNGIYLGISGAYDHGAAVARASAAPEVSGADLVGLRVGCSIAEGLVADALCHAAVGDLVGVRPATRLVELV